MNDMVPGMHIQTQSVLACTAEYHTQLAKT